MKAHFWENKDEGGRERCVFPRSDAEVEEDTEEDVMVLTVATEDSAERAPERVGAWVVGGGGTCAIERAANLDSVATVWRGGGRVDEALLERLLSDSAMRLKSSDKLQFAFNAAAFEDL